MADAKPKKVYTTSEQLDRIKSRCRSIKAILEESKLNPSKTDVEKLNAFVKAVEKSYWMTQLEQDVRKKIERESGDCMDAKAKRSVSDTVTLYQPAPEALEETNFGDPCLWYREREDVKRWYWKCEDDRHDFVGDIDYLIAGEFFGHIVDVQDAIAIIKCDDPLTADLVFESLYNEAYERGFDWRWIEEALPQWLPPDIAAIKAQGDDSTTFYVATKKPRRTWRVARPDK